MSVQGYLNLTTATDRGQEHVLKLDVFWSIICLDLELINNCQLVCVDWQRARFTEANVVINRLWGRC
jgi:hypothetical protein